jgi:uncharacterized membrane protein YqhA
VSSATERFERILWGSRVIVLVPVVGALILSIGSFVLGAVDTVSIITTLASYLGPAGASAEHGTIRSDLITGIVKAVDADLIGAIMLVVSMGLYELFIKHLDVAESSEVADRVLTVRTLDDLKERISRLVLLILIVEFFGIALGLSITTSLDLLLLGVGIFLIAAAMWLASRH